MNGFALAFRLARRELRGGLKGFRVFLACLTLGVMAITGVQSVSQAVKAGLQADGQRLLGGDVELRTLHHAITDAQSSWLDTQASVRSSVVKMRAMAQVPDNRALVELKAVDDAYPLVGALDLEPVQGIQSAIALKGGVWGAAADRNLLTRLDLNIGDTLRVGEATFEIRATIGFEPDRVATVINFGPRLMIHAGALPATGLVQEGSQIRYYERLLLAAKGEPKAWVETLKQQFPKAGWRIRSTEEAAPGIQQFIDRMSMFLTFVGLTALLVGGIGVLGAVKSYLDSRLATIATFKCLGASSALVFKVYLIQVIGLGAIGVMIGLVLGGLTPYLFVGLLGGLLPVTPQVDLYPAPFAQGAAFGLLTAVTFALWPLAKAQQTPAAGLFRTLITSPEGRPKSGYIAASGLGLVALALLVIFTAPERNFAYWFVGVSTVVLLLLRFGAWAVMKGAAKIKNPPGAVWRLVIANLYRPGATTPSVVLALGLGLAVLVAVAQVQGNLTSQVEERLPDQAPAFFFIDIQPHQVEPFDRTVLAIDGARDLQRVASLRGRIVKINDVPVEEVDIDPGVSWAVRGDRALTYARDKREGTEIVDGEWWPTDYQGPPLISFDAKVARGFGVGVGDTLTLNILGREITAEIASLRAIDWRTLRFDFAIIFAPGTLEGAPHTHIAAIKVPSESEEAMERAVVKTFSNISAIRVKEALEAASIMLAGIGAAISGTSVITILSGALVLAGTIAAARKRRIYDSVVFKVLGATRKQVLAAFVLEYGLLGLFTGIIAAGVGTLASWAVMTILMQTTWIFLPLTTLITVLACIAFTVAAGYIGTWRVLGRKAAPYLRNE